MAMAMATVRRHLGVLRSDGSVLRVNDLHDVVELILDGILLPDDLLLGGDYRGAALEEIDDLGWAFALADDASPYARYEVVAPKPRG